MGTPQHERSLMCLLQELAPARCRQGTAEHSPCFASALTHQPCWRQAGVSCTNECLHLASSMYPACINRCRARALLGFQVLSYCCVHSVRPCCWLYVSSGDDYLMNDGSPSLPCTELAGPCGLLSGQAQVYCRDRPMSFSFTAACGAALSVIPCLCRCHSVHVHEW